MRYGDWVANCWWNGKSTTLTNGVVVVLSVKGLFWLTNHTSYSIEHPTVLSVSSCLALGLREFPPDPCDEDVSECCVVSGRTCSHAHTQTDRQTHTHSLTQVSKDYIEVILMYVYCVLWDLLAMTDRSQYWNNIPGVVYPPSLM